MRLSLRIYIAMIHVTIGVCVMATAKKRVQHFARWEHYKDKVQRVYCVHTHSNILDFELCKT